MTIKGRHIYLGTYNSPESNNSPESKRTYNRVIAEFLTAGETFGIKPQDLTIAELLAAYAKHCEAYFGTGTASEWHRVKVALRSAFASC